MKKFILIMAIMFGTLFASQAQSGTYFEVGTSITQVGGENKLNQELGFGGFQGKHQFGVGVDTYQFNEVSAKRQWFPGVKYQFNAPLGRQVDAIFSGKGKVNLTEGSQNEILFEPRIGLGFNITPRLAFQIGAGAEFNELNKFKNAQGQLNVGLRLRTAK